ncbi:hypothetical protein L7F22_048154 [Adiantum nelumboides]|nr:hypothetical protein [Adiantum nelumboides]
MKFALWNVRGINARQKQCRLWHILLTSVWDVLCVVEHKLHKKAGASFQHKGFTVFYSGAHGSQSGVLFLVKTSLQPMLVRNDVHGRYIILEIQHHGEILWLAGLYAPNVALDRSHPWTTLNGLLALGRPGILMGDFNVCSHPLQSSSQHALMDSPERRAWSCMECSVLKQELWSWLYPDDPGYTFQFAQYTSTWSRLDRIYIMYDDFFLPEVLTMTVECHHVLSDHFPVVFQMLEQRAGIFRTLLGKAPLKFNSSFLQHSLFRDYISQIIANFTALLPSCGLEAWDAYVANVQKVARQCAECMIKHIAELQLTRYQKARVTAISESLVDHNMQTHCFYRWLHPVHACENIVRLQNDVGDMVVDPSTLISMCHGFTSFLGPPDIVDADSRAARNYMFDLVRAHLARDMAAALEADISEHEVEAVRLHLPKNKSPGWDGLTNELFSTYANDLKQPITSLCQQVWVSGSMPTSWKIGLVKLLPKTNCCLGSLGKSSTNLSTGSPRLGLLMCGSRLLRQFMLPMLSYYMPLLPWTSKAISQVTQPVRFMLWKKNNLKPGIVWVSWPHISTPKRMGGVAILDLWMHMLARRWSLLQDMCLSSMQPWVSIAEYFICQTGLPYGKTKIDAPWWHIVNAQQAFKCKQSSTLTSLVISWQEVLKIAHWKPTSTRERANYLQSEVLATSRIITWPSKTNCHRQFNRMARLGIVRFSHAMLPHRNCLLSFRAARHRFHLPRGYRALWECLHDSLSSFHVVLELAAEFPWDDWQVQGKKSITKFGSCISKQVARDIRVYIAQRFGSDYIPPIAREFQSKVINTLEAHEAIRVTNVQRIPSALCLTMDKDALALYTLIWIRTVESQMKQAIYEEVSVDFVTEVEALCLQATVNHLGFPGFLAASMAEGTSSSFRATFSSNCLDHQDSARKSRDKVLALKEGDVLFVKKAETQQHFTSALVRYSEGLLVKAMAEAGIGRPSTYASIVKSLQTKKYVRIENQQIIPEVQGLMVISFLSCYLSNFVDCNTAALLEKQLDEVSGGLLQSKKVLRKFWPAFNAQVSAAMKMTDGKMEKFLHEAYFTQGSTELGFKGRVCPRCGTGKLLLKRKRMGRGYYLSCTCHPLCSFKARVIGEKKENAISECYSEKTATVSLGVDPVTNLEVMVKSGPYGAYIQLGKDEKGLECFKIPHGLKPTDVNMEQALQLMKYPLELGKHPEDGHAVILGLNNKCYFVKHQSTMAKLSKKENIEGITLERALKLLKERNKSAGKLRVKKTERKMECEGEHEDSEILDTVATDKKEKIVLQPVVYLEPNTCDRTADTKRKRTSTDCKGPSLQQVAVFSEVFSADNNISATVEAGRSKPSRQVQEKAKRLRGRKRARVEAEKEAENCVPAATVLNTETGHMEGKDAASEAHINDAPGSYAFSP